MTEQDDLKIRLDTMNDKVRALESELSASRQQIAKVLEMIEKQHDRLNFHESSIARVDRILLQILTGRTWRTLRATGELIKRLVTSRLSGNVSDSVALTQKRSFIICTVTWITD